MVSRGTAGLRTYNYGLLLVNCCFKTLVFLVPYLCLTMNNVCVFTGKEHNDFLFHFILFCFVLMECLTVHFFLDKALVILILLLKVLSFLAFVCCPPTVKMSCTVLEPPIPVSAHLLSCTVWRVRVSCLANSNQSRPHRHLHNA